MAAPLPQAGDPLALLRPTGRAARGRAGLQTAAAPQRTAGSAAGAAAAAQRAQGATQAAARALSFAQLLGKAADQRQTAAPAAQAGLDEALHAERQARTTLAEDDLGAQADAALEPASLQTGAAALAPVPPPAAVATALPAPGEATAGGVPLAPAAAAVDAADPPTALPQRAEPAATPAQAPAQALGQPAPRSDGRNPHNNVARAALAAPTPATAQDLGPTPATSTARPAETRAGEAPAPAIAEALRAPTDGAAARPASTPAPGAAAGPTPAPEAGAQASRAWQAIDPAAGQTAVVSVRGDSDALRRIDRPAEQRAEQPAVRASAARAPTPAAPVQPFGQEATEAGSRAQRAATEGGVAAGTVGAHGPAGNGAGTPAAQPGMPAPDAAATPATPATPAAPAAPRAPGPAPAAAAVEPASAAPPARVDAASDAPMPMGSWIAAPATVAATIAGAPALPGDAQASLAAHPQSAAFAPEMGAQLTHFARNGIEHARLALNPAEMGPVTVQIQLEGSNAQVHLSAEHALTRQALEQAMPQLAGSLREAGLTLSGGGVFEQPRQGRDASGADDGRRPQPARAGAGDDDAALAGLAATATPALRRRGVVDLVA